MHYEKMFDSRYEAALDLAAKAHQGQMRKGSATPYITHVVHVAATLERAGFSSEVAAAGLLHDAPEDTGLSLSTIEEVCGHEVAVIVEALTEKKRDADGNERPWKVRKEERLASLRAYGVDAQAVAVADALHNIKTTIADVQREGAIVWTRFKQPDLLVWYYREIQILAMHGGLNGLALLHALTVAINELEELTLCSMNVI